MYGGRAPRALSRPSCSSPFPRFEAALTLRHAPQDPGRGRLHSRCCGNRLISVDRRIYSLLIATPQEESRHSDVEVDKEMVGLRIDAKDSQEDMNIMFECFKGIIKKLRDLSPEIHRVCTKIAALVADENIRENFSIPKGIKKTLHLIDEMKEIPMIRDFNLAIPYGFFLIAQGFVTTVKSGSFSAMWFGCHLGSVLLEQSASSFRSWKSGQSSFIYLKRQSVIMTIISMRKWWLCYKNYSYHNHFDAIISGTMVLLSLYWMIIREQTKGTRSEGRNLVVKKMHSDVEVENNIDEPKKEGNESLEETRKMPKYFSEAINKMQDMSQKIYASYAKITTLLSNETGIKAPFPLLNDLEKIGCYWINDFKEMPGVRDFDIGIPYGIFLVIWGFITFMRTRRISALCFGCHLGYVLINQSIISFRSWKRGLSYEKPFFRQFAIVGIFPFMVLCLYFESNSFHGYFLKHISVAVGYFYIYMSITDPGAGSEFREVWRGIFQTMAGY